MAKYTGNSMSMVVGVATLSGLVSVEINEAAATYDTTVVGENAETHLPGKTNGQGTINILDDTAEAAFKACVPGTSYAMEFYPQGNTSGKPKRAFTATVTGRQRPVSHNAATPVTINFQVSGAITDSTVTP